MLFSSLFIRRITGITPLPGSQIVWRKLCVIFPVRSPIPRFSYGILNWFCSLWLLHCFSILSGPSRWNTVPISWSIPWSITLSHFWSVVVGICWMHFLFFSLPLHYLINTNCCINCCVLHQLYYMGFTLLLFSWVVRFIDFVPIYICVSDVSTV